MKAKFTLFVLAILCSTTINAQKIVALHSPTNGVQYFNDDYSLQTAYEAAVAGDTIYLPGGTNIPPTRFEKQLTIFGAGYHPSATAATYPTKISGNLTLSDEADGFYLEGVEITGYLTFDTNESVDNVTIKRCKMYSLSIAGDRTYPSVDNNFIENVIPSLSVDNLMNSMFFNNIIQSAANLRNLSFLNNVFTYSNAGSSTSQVISYANNCLFKNNVFLQENNNICEGLGSSTWANNIFCTSTTSPILGTDPTFGVDGNYFMTRAEVLVNQTGNVFDYDHDYHLQAAAALNLGDDGTETGIYGGFYPWKEFSIPINPHISSKTISPTTDTNGMIQVDINVHAQDE